MSSKTESAEAADRSFVVVASRLPVDRVEGPDGRTDWQTSPGGLVTALEPVMRDAGGAWIGWSGPGSVRGGRPAPGRAGPVRDRGQAVLRGFLQRHAVAALPRRHHAAMV